MATDEHDVSRTVPSRGLPRENPRVGLLIVVGSGAAPDTLRAPRSVVMEDLALEIGRRPPPRQPGLQSSLAIADATVSGTHARVQRASSGADLFIIQDLGSTNGTFVDGRRAEGPTPLRDGAVLFLGSQVVVFRIVTTAELEALQEDAAHPLAPLPTLSPIVAATAAKLRRLAATD